MILWCAYCQEFQGEVAPFHDYSLTHGICAKCAIKGLHFSGDDAVRIMELKEFQEKFFNSGIKSDESQLKLLIKEARQKGIRNTDILMGILAPALWKIGDLWFRNKVTAADEHRFTTLMQKIIQQTIPPAIESKLDTKTDILLVNAEGNIHDLGVQVLNLWLQDHGFQSRIVSFDKCTQEHLVNEIEVANPKIVGISVALTEQITPTMNLIQSLKAALGPRLPKICVGGNALKIESSVQIPDAFVIRDIRQLLGIIL